MLARLTRNMVTLLDEGYELVVAITTKAASIPSIDQEIKLQ